MYFKLFSLLIKAVVIESSLHIINSKIYLKIRLLYFIQKSIVIF